jgi:hypothetical protein
MTVEEAKQILLRYREGTLDANDPDIVQALELAARDRELNTWFADHRSFQNTVSDSLRTIPVPADLKSRILNGRPVSHRFSRGPLLALAAAFAILAVAVSVWFSKPLDNKTFANFQARMINFALRTYAMDILSADPAQVRDYLAAHGAPADYSLTPALSRLPVKGGGRLSWQNHPVAMICFSLPQNETLYLFVIDRTSVPDRNAADNVSTVSPGKHLSTATWSDGKRVYMLAAPLDAKSLEKLANQNG